MTTYVKLNDDRIMVVFSDNTEDETMHGYPVEDEYTWDCELNVCDTWGYDEVIISDSNLSIVEQFAQNESSTLNIQY